MALSDIRTAIAGILSGVSGVGIVYEYERFASSWTDFLSLFKTTAGKINGWSITRRRTPADWDVRRVADRAHAFVLRGVYGLKDADASELDFQDQVEAVVAAFAADRKLGNTVYDCSPVSVDVFEPRVFGTVLCHYAELSLEARVSQTYSG